MSDCIIAQITANRKAALQAITTVGEAYTFTPAVVEEQRLVQNINGRYPYVLLVQEDATIEEESNYSEHVIQKYTVVCINEYNDDDPDDDEIVKEFRNVNADIIKAWMVDKTCGGLAEYTRTLGYNSEVNIDTKGINTFVSWVVFEVEALIDSTNPYLKG